MTTDPDASRRHGKPVISLRGTGTRNLGAALMMRAVVQELSDEYVVSVPARSSDYLRVADLGALKQLDLAEFGRFSEVPGRFVPHDLRRAYGLHLPRDSVAILDAAGFLYSDSFTKKRVLREASALSRWGRSIPVILLPQAFGPFTDPEIMEAVRGLIDVATLVYARDRESYDAINDLMGRSDPKVRLAPDFTASLMPHPVSPTEPNRVTIVPNTKVLNMAEAEGGGRVYTGQLTQLVASLRSRNRLVELVPFEAADTDLCHQLAEDVGSSVYEPSDELDAIAHVGASGGMVGSRYHGLVCALLQARPVLVAGWSHKYLHLLEDFDRSGQLLGRAEEPGALDELAETLSRQMDDPAEHRHLTRAGDSYRANVMKLWSEVRACLS